MLYCDRIESAKFIHGTPSPANPEYSNIAKEAYEVVY